MKTIFKFFCVGLFFSSLSMQSAFAGEMLGSELGCVADGIRQATGGRVEPSEKWIALLAAGAQEFAGPRAIIRGGEKDKTWLQTRVISMVQTYGFCSAYPRNNQDVGFGNAVDKNDAFLARTFFMGSARTSFTSIEKPKQVRFLESMGIKEPNFLTKNVQPLKDMFKYEGDWWTSAPADRREDFLSFLNSAVGTTPTVAQEGATSPPIVTNIFDDSNAGKGLKECLSQIDGLHKNNPIYKESDKDHRRASYDFCKTVAASCEIDGSQMCSLDGVRSGSPSPTTPGTGGGGGTAGDFFGRSSGSAGAK